MPQNRRTQDEWSRRVARTGATTRATAVVVDTELAEELVGTPAIPPLGPDDKPCYIDIIAMTEMRPGQRRRLPFIYYVGDPVMATAFGIEWYTDPDYIIKQLSPLPDTEILPIVKFRPPSPFPDTLNEKRGIVEITVPLEIRYDHLYPRLLLLH